MSRLRWSLVITFFASNGATAVHFITAILLARLLSPAEIGIFSITAVLVAIAHVFRDFGVTSYLLQEKELTTAAIRASMGVLVASSWLLALCLFLASGWIADFFIQPGIKPVMQVLAAGFLFIPFGAVPHTLLTRDYRAKEQAIVSIAGVTTYCTTALFLAYSGFSYMSLAWANLANILVSGLAYTLYRPVKLPWLPSFRGWSKVANFGAGTVLGGCVTQVNNALPDMMLGKSSGPHDVGLLSRANATAGIFEQIAGPTVNYAALPYLSQLHHGGEKLRIAIAKASAYLTACGWAPLAVSAVFSNEIVLFLYGAKWVECVPLMPILCLAAAIGMAFNFHWPGLLAVGRPYLAIAPSAALLVARVACILTIFDGSLLSFVWALALAKVATIPVNLHIQARYFDVGMRDFLIALRPSFAVAAICLGVAGALHAVIPATLSIALRLAIAGVVMFPVWILSVILVRHPLQDEFTRVGERFPPVARVLTFLRRTS
jgi:O-antigen/teichoic acid export membrane protein